MLTLVTIYHNLGGVHQDLGDLQQAKQYYEKALKIRTEKLGSNHVDVARSYNNLGTEFIKTWEICNKPSSIMKRR